MKMRHFLAVLSLITAITSVGCNGWGTAVTGGHNLPPAQRLLEPGPGVGGPGPGVIAPASAMQPIGGNYGGQYCPPGGAPGYMGGPAAATYGGTAQVLFVDPEGMQVRWDVGTGGFDSEPLMVPGRTNFGQGAIYRIKLSHVPGREGVELYPTLEVGPASPRSEAYLAHNSVPIQFTEEDFDQVLYGNFVTKVIYLPDPEFQDLALAGIDTLVSTRLDPGVDPITEADRRGAILAILRMGNIDPEMPGMGAPQFQGVVPADYSAAAMQGGHVGQGAPAPAYVAGVTVPQYGMPQTGTPIGLPGPPHIPLGGPAGLQEHTMRNHTRRNIPGPTQDMRIDVRQRPGQSYPEPANHVRIRERSIHPTPNYHQPLDNRVQLVP